MANIHTIFTIRDKGLESFNAPKLANAKFQTIFTLREKEKLKTSEKKLVIKIKAVKKKKLIKKKKLVEKQEPMEKPKLMKAPKLFSMQIATDLSYVNEDGMRLKNPYKQIDQERKQAQRAGKERMELERRAQAVAAPQAAWEAVEARWPLIDHAIRGVLEGLAPPNEDLLRAIHDHTLESAMTEYEPGLTRWSMGEMAWLSE